MRLHAHACRANGEKFPPVWMMRQASRTDKPHSWRDVAWMTRRSTGRWTADGGYRKLPHFRTAWDRPGPAARAAAGTGGGAARDPACPRLPIDADLTRVSQEEWAEVSSSLLPCLHCFDPFLYVVSCSVHSDRFPAVMHSQQRPGRPHRT